MALAIKCNKCGHLNIDKRPVKVCDKCGKEGNSDTIYSSSYLECVELCDTCRGYVDCWFKQFIGWAK